MSLAGLAPGSAQAKRTAKCKEEMVATTMCRRYLAKLLKREGFITVQ